MKAELRERLKKLRRTVPAEVRAQKSARIAAQVEALDVWQRARTVMLFVPLPAEVDVRLLERAARAAGKRVAAPRMVGEDLEVREWLEGAEVPSGRMGVVEPPETAAAVPPGEVDLVIVPALALDPTGGRLGYGAGMYDRLLPRLTAAVRVGVAFDLQLLAEVPMSPTDQRVAWIVTEERTHPVEKTA